MQFFAPEYIRSRVGFESNKYIIVGVETATYLLKIEIEVCRNLTKGFFMTTDLPPIPPAVIEFAEKNNCKDVKSYDVGKYKNQYMVFIATSKADDLENFIILYNKIETRFAEGKEIEDIWERFY